MPVIMASKVFNNLPQFVNTIKSIHFRNIFFKLLPVSFRKATHYKHMFEFASRFGLCVLKDSFHRFLFGFSCKSAGINDHGVDTPDGNRIKCDFQIAGIKLFKQQFGINEILGAAKRDNTYCMRPGSGFQPE